MSKKYIVRLTGEERSLLTDMVTKGKSAAYKIRHADILPKADADGPAWTDERMAVAFSAHTNTVAGVRQRFAEQGTGAAIGRRKQDFPSYSPESDGESGARLIALRCGSPPEGNTIRQNL